MAADDNAVSPAVGARARGLARDEVGELTGKVLEIGRRREGDLRVNRERQQSRALLMRAGLHAADVADDGSGGADQVFHREAILRASGDVADAVATGDGPIITAGSTKARRAHENALDAAARAVLHQLDQPGLLEGTQVVVDALTPEGELGGQLCGGRGRAQSFEERAAHGRQRQPHGVRLLEQGDGSGHRPTRYIRKINLSIVFEGHPRVPVGPL